MQREHGTRFHRVSCRICEHKWNGALLPETADEQYLSREIPYKYLTFRMRLFMVDCIVRCDRRKDAAKPEHWSRDHRGAVSGESQW